MEYRLRWGAVPVPAVLDDQGLLHFACPFCGRDTFFRPEDFRATKREVRTTGVALCQFGECNVPYEIVHSCFVPLQVKHLNPMHLYERWYAPGIMHAVWKSRHERHR